MQLNQTVTFSKQDIQNILIEKAKEQIKEMTGKDPTGSSTFKMSSADGVPENEGAMVLFQCNGKR